MAAALTAPTSMRLFRVIVLVIGLPLLLSGCREAPRSIEPAPSSVVRAQVWIYWGGGEPRSWKGTIGLPSAPAETTVVWLADLEMDDDLAAGAPLALPWQQVPAGLSSELERRAARRPPPPPSTLAVETTTEGDADGVVVEITADREAAIDLALGGIASSPSLGDLLAGTAVLPADEAGNVVLIGGRDMSQLAPFEQLHHGRRAHLLSLHTHSNFSTNAYGVETLAEGLAPWVRRIWWTDHQPGSARRIAGGSFDRREDLGFWTGVERLATTSRILSVQDAYAGSRALAIRVIGAGGDVARTRHLGGAGLVGVPISVFPRLRWAWKVPTPDSGIAFVEVELGSGHRLRYLSAAPFPAADETEEADEFVVAATPGAWIPVERDLAADLGRSERDEAVRQITLGVVLTGDTTMGMFDEIELDVPDPRELELLREKRLTAPRQLISHLAAEQSLRVEPDGVRELLPHLTFLAPTGITPFLEQLATATSTAQRRNLVAAVHAGGGCVGVHHLQEDESYVGFLDNRGFGVDLFEIGGSWLHLQQYSTAAERRDRDAHGYPERFEDEVYPLLVRWDRTTARGLLLTGHGAPDLNGRFDRANDGYFDRWLSWVYADDDRPGALLDALRAGRASGSEWRSDTRLDLTAGDALVMGKLVVTDRPSFDVRVRYGGVVPGARLRWIVGRFAASGATDVPPARAARVDLLESPEGERSLAVEVGDGVFVRTEVLDPTGHLVAFSNPLHLVPFAPLEWPRGRVAFDWSGLRLLEEKGLVLEQADLEEGRLTLAGEMHGAGARLRLSLPRGATARLPLAPAGAEILPRSDAEPFTLECASAGRFVLEIDLGRPQSRWPVAPLERIPPRKELYFELDVGDSSPTTSALLAEGFSPLRGWFNDPWRVVRDDGARFRLPVPPGEPAWLKIASVVGNRVGGRLFAGGKPLRRFGPYDGLVFALPADRTAAVDGEGRLDFEIRFDPGTITDSGALLLVRRLQIFRGDGVVDY